MTDSPKSSAVSTRWFAISRSEGSWWSSWKQWTSGQIALALIGLILLGFGTSWWMKSFKKNKLRPSPVTWCEPYDFIGLDFLHNYYAARYWINGGNPFREPFGDPLGRKLCYPPIVVPCFAWCQFCGPRNAVGIWMVVLAVYASIGTVAAWYTRRRLNLTSVPLPFALALILLSSPVVYAMERGNYDLAVVPLIVIAAWALQQRTLGRDTLAGSCLALAACIKFYPGLLVLGLLPLRRYRAFVLAGFAGIGFMLFQASNLPYALANLKELAAAHDPEFVALINPTSHSLTQSWFLLWEHTRLARLTHVPSTIATALILGSVLLWVSQSVYHCRDPRQVIVPYFLWIAGVASYVPMVANDYSLGFIPLAALAVWDRRDSIPTHVALAFLFVWAQPLRFTIDFDVLFVMKLAAVFGIAAALVNRIREIDAEGSSAPLPEPLG